MRILAADVAYPAFDQLLPLFLDYYRHLERHGALKLAAHGDRLWLEGVKKSLNRTAVLVVAERDGVPAGFGHGQLKVGPDYLGHLRVGVVGHFYLDERARGSGAAHSMFGLMRTWFQERGAHSIELQVVEGNASAKRFWDKMGFRDELVQMRLVFSREAA